MIRMGHLVPKGEKEGKKKVDYYYNIFKGRRNFDLISCDMMEHNFCGIFPLAILKDAWARVG